MTDYTKQKKILSDYFKENKINRRKLQKTSIIRGMIRNDKKDLVDREIKKIEEELKNDSIKTLMDAS